MNMTEQILEATAENASFSRQLPGLQTSVDSTSLGEAKLCPRRYFYSIIMGYQPRLQSDHLIFGIYLHQAREFYDHARAKGLTHDQSLVIVLKNLMSMSWDKDLRRPNWVSALPTKNRYTLIRTAVWYLDDFGENDPIETLILANGKPAVELSFSMPIDLISGATGEQYMLCGHFDRIGRLGSCNYGVDLKTSEHKLDPGFFAKFSPDNQISLYNAACRVVFDIPVEGFIIDGVQVLAGGSRHQRGEVKRTDDQIEEFLRSTKVFLGQMEQYAEDQFWPMNDKVCGMYGGCSFRDICAKPPGSRQLWLERNYTRRVWDPLKRRGEI